MKRKTIGVCVTGYDWECETRVIYGMYNRCMELDINLLVFSNLIRKPDLYVDTSLPEDVIRGECEIYNLINYELLDGIAIFGDSIIDEKVLFDVTRRAKEHGIPVVNINDNIHDICTNVILSDRYAMEAVVRHLVDDHGLKKINFISGFKGNIQSEERLEAYKKVLSENGIPIEESRIGYGEFWKKAYECTEKFLTSGDLPEAIVCANDSMAIFCMDCIKDHGYKIPDDIVVTGFDAINDCEMYSPSFTTVRRAFQESGEVTVDLILDILNGKDTPHNYYVDSVLVKKQSCGCIPLDTEDRTDFIDVRYGKLHRYKAFNSYILDVNTSFANAKNPNDLFSSLDKGAEFFNLNKVYVCICSNADKSNTVFENKHDNKSGISETMISMYRYGHNIEPGVAFPSSQLLPESFLDGEHAVFFAFSPLYFTNRFLGYLAYEPTGLEGNGDLFVTWTMTISNFAGNFYINKELKCVANELENLYMRDPLTGLYNRRGMNRLGYELIERAKKNGEWVTIICADVDGLKSINDRYGHEAGDIAITCTAKAIESSVPAESVCTRTGGDEYCVIMSHCGRDDISDCIAAIDKYLEDYNAKSGLPYKVGCSCGYFSINSAEFIALDSIIKAADENMYEVKTKKKTQRK